ncbi:MAG TPA: DNA polymerase III subunit delta' [Smithellaceae bacterium]|nr:DNA polymerase III subunit delta' [Smithellaceae bacterium]
MSFLDIYGHERQIAILKKAIAQKRVGHAYLFSGINGAGKRTLAGEFAKALNCERADTLHDACEKCSSCLKARHASHADIIFIAAEGQFIRINAIREIQERMKFKPLEGGWRAVIIDDADKMNDHAANALLKTLEEPSAANILILVSSRPYSLPATIISRCRHMRFNPLPATAVSRFLGEQRGMDRQKASLLAGLSGGSVGRALELDQEDISAYRAEIMQLLMKARKDDPISLLNLVSNFGQDKKKIKQGMDIVSSCFRDALILKETRKAEMLLNADHPSFINTLARRLSGEQILQNIFLVARAWGTIELNVNKTLTLETMAFKLNI